jgi:photosystem II stability/assembly factor-like uncharacterized protein
LFCVLFVAVLPACGGGGREGAPPAATPSPAAATPIPTTPVSPAATTPIPTTTVPLAGLVAWAAGANQVLRSDDGGSHWISIQNPGGRRLAFVDRDTGWLIGGSSFIVHTIDGGRQWANQTKNIAGVLPVLIDVAALDGMRAVAVGSENPVDDPARSHDGPPVVLVTSNGGATWRRARLDGVDPSLLAEVRLTSVCLTTAGLGLATGTDFKNFEQTVVLITRDAGETWENITARLPLRFSARVGCTPGEQLWFLAGESTVVRSSDGGLTWEDRGTDLRPNLTPQALTFVDPSTGWLVAEDPSGVPSAPGRPGHRIVLLDTQDAGEHWGERLVASDRGELTLAVDFFDRRRGVVVAQDLHPLALPRSSFGLSFVTTDGGATWTETVHPEPIDALWDVELFP